MHGDSILTSHRASGLGRACVEDICNRGGYVAVLDMNEELASEVIKQIGNDKTKFFECNVLETESVEAAVRGAVEWSRSTGKKVGGVIAAAGVSTPAKVSSERPEGFHGLIQAVRYWTEIISHSL